jgi:hypothetical protein
MSKETVRQPINGWAMLTLDILLYLAIIPLIYLMGKNFQYHGNVDAGYFGFLLAIDVIAAILISSGFVVLQPNESAVLLLFGKYKYSAKVGGFWWVNPFYTKRKLSLRLRNHNGDRLKVNDKAGNRDRQRARLEGRGHVRRAF